VRADARGIAAAVAAGAAGASIAYTAFAIARLRRFDAACRSRTARRAAPHVTVLKPVAGDDPELEANLRSFCEQTYGSFDVVIGALGDGDAALPVARDVARRFPHRVRVVAGDGVARYANPKIANLAAMLPHARGEILIVADADMRVTPDYLEVIVAAFDDPDVGAVTAPYRGEPADGARASLLGAMWITEQFAPSVLVARALEPLTYTFGSTMAVRRTTLERIGGIGALGDHLADDHALGALVTAAGERVALAPYVVANVVREAGLRALLHHELRWARTIRAVRPASYPGIALTYPVPLAVLALALARRKPRAAVLVVAALFARAALHRTAVRTLGARYRAGAGEIVARDALGFAAWLLGLRGSTVRWRGRVMRAGKH
jgi:ceramide glucosyltransferase